MVYIHNLICNFGLFTRLLCFVVWKIFVLWFEHVFTPLWKLHLNGIATIKFARTYSWSLKLQYFYTVDEERKSEPRVFVYRAGKLY